MPVPIHVALDTADLGRALAWGQAVRPHVGGLKLGLEFFAAQGPQGVERVAALGLPIFLDLKFHDIPATVAAAVRATCRPGVALMTVHASGGPAMLRAAADAAREAGKALGIAPPRLVAVTVLTSLDERDLSTIGQFLPIPEQATRLASLAQEAGLAGVVCSPQEVAALRARFGPGLLLVVPGVRPAGAGTADQKRTLSPLEAARAGADIVVIGRPITAAPDPGAAAAAIARELASV